MLNHYLTEMSDAILDHGGTLVAYMGDGIMAVFGAPLDQPDHADRALAAAREMLDAAGALQRVDRERHGDGFSMGIGINSGPVMSGNVGSERRLEYTAIGDTTNTAARLEGMTKGSGYAVFVAESTSAAWTRRRPTSSSSTSWRCAGAGHGPRLGPAATAVACGRPSGPDTVGRSILRTRRGDESGSAQRGAVLRDTEEEGA